MVRYAFSRALASGAAAIALIAASAAPADAATSCADLATLKIAASDIGLPSGGATITSAQVQTVPGPHIGKWGMVALASAAQPQYPLALQFHLLLVNKTPCFSLSMR